MDTDYLNQLNDQQRDAVLYCDGPQLVIAGAGSGKTRVLTYKIVHLLKLGLAPYRIMALTFTNKAAREMRERVMHMVDSTVARQLWMGTFHSIFSRLLRANAERIGFKSDFTIYDATDSRSLIKLIIKDMGLDDKVYKPASLQSLISNMKNALIAPDDYERNASLRSADDRAQRPMTYAIYKAYWNRCRVAGAMDFDDLLFYTNILFRDHEDVLARYQDMFEYILVDEYQDTNFAQHLIVSQLCRKHSRLCVVGDDAQSIYSFRGANITNILELEKRYPGLKTFKLERNYRSTQRIIEAANSLIEKNKHQISKHIFSKNDIGDRIPVVQCYSGYEEAYVVANTIASLKARMGCSYEDFAVLYRTNAQSRTLEEALNSGGRRDKHGHVRDAIPYRIYGGLSFYQRKEIKDAVCYFRLLINPDDDEALRRVINTPARGIGDTTVTKVQHCAMERGVSMWQVMNAPDELGLAVHGGTRKKLAAFVELIAGLAALNAEGKDASQVANEVIRRTQLLSVLMGDKTPENISRQENLEELMNAVNDFVLAKEEEGEETNKLADFLAETSLLTDQDQDDGDNTERVTLMTVHAAKGLEFKNVIIVGVEEDLFPSSMSCDTLAGIEEERRLLYVAITRAMVNCVITFATSRFRNGQTFQTVASRFLGDIDPQYLQMSATSSSFSPSSTATTAPRYGIRPVRKIADPVSSIPSRATVAPKPTHISRASSPSETSLGEFSIHTVDEVSEGCVINHSRFGEGAITHVDTSGAEPKIIVDFGVVGVKTLLLKFAKFKIL
ncbi:MAG: UvrD-helicase domain-containing protein [Muribaculaceae bacterium]|nr:UvrD-helicase domain-containing protein [Muribaculaceae bacterium]